MEQVISLIIFLVWMLCLWSLDILPFSFQRHNHLMVLLSDPGLHCSFLRINSVYFSRAAANLHFFHLRALCTVPLNKFAKISFSVGAKHYEKERSMQLWLFDIGSLLGSQVSQSVLVPAFFLDLFNCLECSCYIFLMLAKLIDVFWSGNSVDLRL